MMEPKDVQSSKQIEIEIFRSVNAYRRSRGLSELRPHRKMNDLAREHSRWMASRSNMSHRGADDRFERLQPDGFMAFAENVAYNLGHADPALTAVRGWIDSPGHHRNMIDSSYDLTGVGVAQGSDGSWYFTQLFGRRN